MEFVLPLGGRWMVERFLYVLNGAFTYSPVWCYSFKSFCVHLWRRQSSMLPCMKYLFLGGFLLLAQQNTKCLGEFLLLALPNTKCHDLGMLAGWWTALLCLWWAFTLLANRIQAAYYWVTAWAAYFKICVLRLFTQAVLCYLITNG